MRSKDKSRLDFVQNRAWSVGMNFKSESGKNGKFRCWCGDKGDGYGETIRQAIDAAIKAERRRPSGKAMRKK